MKIVIAMDSFKGSMSSIESGTQIKETITSLLPEAEIVVLPLADGGEGTMQALIHGLGGVIIEKKISGPLGTEVLGRYGITNKNVAVIEMAESSGLTLIPESLRNPLITNTYGLGELILDALGQGCREFIIGIGGSATNDLGTGMLTALGVKFYDKYGNVVPPCGGNLGRICQIDTSEMDNRVNQSKFRIACDVKNPLLGEYGCAKVFSPQKGAAPEDVNTLERNAEAFAEVVSTLLAKDLKNTPGAGAAGGLGYGFLCFLPAKLESGVDIVLDEIRIEEQIKDADIVITGEGSIDSQSIFGKAPIGIAKRAKAHGAFTIGFCGSVGAGAEVCNSNGLDAYFPIIQTPCSLEEAMEYQTAKDNLSSVVKQVFNLICHYDKGCLQ